MYFSVGEQVRMKKPHACGCYEWRITRVGADFKIVCLKCGREVMLTRQSFEKSFKKRVLDNAPN